MHVRTVQVESAHFGGMTHTILNILDLMKNPVPYNSCNDFSF